MKVKDDVVKFLSKYYKVTYDEVINVVSKHTGEPVDDTKRNFNLPLTKDEALVRLVGMFFIHEFIEAIEIKRKFGKVILPDWEDEEWKKAYCYAHPIALKGERKYYISKGRWDLAKETYSRLMRRTK